MPRITDLPAATAGDLADDAVVVVVVGGQTLRATVAQIREEQGGAGVADLNGLGTFAKPITDATLSAAARDALNLDRAAWDTSEPTPNARPNDYNLQPQA